VISVSLAVISVSLAVISVSLAVISVSLAVISVSLAVISVSLSPSLYLDVSLSLYLYLSQCLGSQLIEPITPSKLLLLLCVATRKHARLRQVCAAVFFVPAAG
jgi:hypothetical protein